MPCVSRRAWLAVAAIVASGVVVVAVGHANRKTDAAVEAVDKLIDCALYADEGVSCEEERKRVSVRWTRV